MLAFTTMDVDSGVIITFSPEAVETMPLYTKLNELQSNNDLCCSNCCLVDYSPRSDKVHISFKDFIGKTIFSDWEDCKDEIIQQVISTIEEFERTY